MEPFEVGDKVWSFKHGESIVRKIRTDLYSIVVGEEVYTGTGKLFVDDKYPTLYHLEDAKRLFPQFFNEEKPEPQKKKKFLAHAILKRYYDDSTYISDELFSHEEEVKKFIGEDYFVKWPAIPSKDGFYEVEE